MRVLLRKTRTVITKSRASAYQAGAYYLEWRRKNQLRNSGLADIIKICERRTAEEGAYAPVYSELFLLYDDVRTRKPKIVFEFGSGCSTFILARALYDNEKQEPGSGGVLYSMESEEFWLEANARWLPEYLASHCRLIHAPVTRRRHKGIDVFSHQNIPDETPDLIYLDGPDYPPDCKIAADVLSLEDRLRPRLLLVIDGRRVNSEFLKRELRRKYRFFERKGIFGGGCVQRCFELLE